MIPLSSFRVPLLGSLVLFSDHHARAAISYATNGALYAENFNSLPNTPINTNIQTSAYPNGWTDDTTTVAANRVGVPGWHLSHPLTLAEGGANGRQRLRIGSGTSTTGAFMAFFSTTANTDIALGELGSNTLAPEGSDVFIGLRLINTTGQTLDSFTLTYDGEQWRNGGSNVAEVLQFAYSTDATAANWNTAVAPPAYTGVTALNFTSPVVSATAAAVDGNAAGRVADITATINGISWPNGGELWLRWAGRNSVGSDDGLAIDNVRFSAVPEPAGSGLLALGAVSLLCLRRRRS